MSSIRPSSQHAQPNDIQYVDPKALEMTGGGFVSPYYFDSVQPNLDLYPDFDFDNDLVDLPRELEEIHTSATASHLRNAEQSDIYLAPTAPINTRRSSLRGDAPEFVPSPSPRPQLTLITDQQELAPQSQLDTTLPTPQICVLPADAESGSNPRPQRASQSRGRTRRRSSPARRPSQSLVRKGAPPYRVLRGNDTGSRLLSPLRAEEWITGHSYHPGDRFPLAVNHDQVHMPTMYPSMPGMGPWPSTTSSQEGGPYYCNFVECKRPDKAFGTLSELKKHQHIHSPKDKRPHACPECDKKFQYPKDVLRHMQAKHYGGTPSKCEYCSKVLSRGDNLQRHLERIHGIMQTPSAPAESSVASPASTMSMSNFSESMYSEAGQSTALTSPSSQTQAASRKLYQRLLLPASPCERPVGPFNTAPTSVPMSRWNTN